MDLGDFSASSSNSSNTSSRSCSSSGSHSSVDGATRPSQHKHESQVPTKSAGAGPVLPPLVLSQPPHDRDDMAQYLPRDAQQSPKYTPRDATAPDPLSLTKRFAVARNALVAPSRCTEEMRVVQRFGVQSTRIPSPPVHAEMLHTKNSKQERHFQTKLRIFGSVENMTKVIAGGPETMTRLSATTIRCDDPRNEVSPRRGSPRTATTSSSKSPRAVVALPSPQEFRIPGVSSSPRGIPYGPNHGIQFVDLKSLERHRAELLTAGSGDFAVGDYSGMECSLPLPPHQPHTANSTMGRTPGAVTMSTTTPFPRAADNDFFLVARATNREHVIASAMSARGGPTLIASRPFDSPPATARSDRLPSTRVDGGRGSVNSFVSRKQQALAPQRTGTAEQPSSTSPLDEIETEIMEDTKFVLAETRKFEKNSRASRRRQWLATMTASGGDVIVAGSSPESSSTQLSLHTSDLLKMIFNSRIALECEAAQQLRKMAEAESMDRLIADATATAQRLALRSATVEEFHHFLCNFLRDPDVSSSESRVIFNAIDSNRSGVIDAAELTDGLRLLLHDESQIILNFGKKMYVETGRHKDAKLSFLEVQAILFALLDFFEVEFSEMAIMKAADLAPTSRQKQRNGSRGTDAGGSTSSPSLAGLGDDAPPGPVAKGPSVNIQQQAGAAGGLRRSDSPRWTKSNSLRGAPGSRGEGATDGALSPSASAQFVAPRLNREASNVSASSAPQPPPKPTMELIKKRMVDECAIVLRESWKYSQAGQVPIPLLRTLTANNAPMLHYAAIRVPTQHFNLKRSGFWKDLLAAEEQKYQAYLAAHNLDLELLTQSKRKLSFGGTSLRGRRRSLKRSGSLSSTIGSIGAVDLNLVKEFEDIQQKLVHTESGSGPGLLKTERSMSITARSPRGGGGATQQPSRPHPGIGSSPSTTTTAPSLANLQPIGYDEYEEANGEVINVANLQSQLKEGGLRLSQMQRALILEQIERGRAQLLASGHSSTSSTRKQSHARPSQGQPSSSRGGGGGGAAGKVVTVVADLSTASSGHFSKDSGGGGGPQDEAFLQAVSRKKSEKSGMKSQHTIDLNEVIDPWHPKFQADHSKMANVARQLSAPEHGQVQFFSRQGTLFTKTANGVIAPYSGPTDDSPTSASGTMGWGMVA